MGGSVTTGYRGSNDEFRSVTSFSKQKAAGMAVRISRLPFCLFAEEEHLSPQVRVPGLTLPGTALGHVPSGNQSLQLGRSANVLGRARSKVSHTRQRPGTPRRLESRGLVFSVSHVSSFSSRSAEHIQGSSCLVNASA